MNLPLSHVNQLLENSDLLTGFFKSSLFAAKRYYKN